MFDLSHIFRHPFDIDDLNFRFQAHLGERRDRSPVHRR